ncbi:OLC1v1003333C1 [Oldenlandia corymbosa var. corymbosa]|uniref:OLC1v1003333C1 n=1 Tax=Oldenlandia corymbosa var. corymbosa TaxID=529605 RepID=A0AAV1DB35_OLDCO|nr:OLC1v1003333C1 [Oldenlandia corymbosa var. corymbosa]
MDQKLHIFFFPFLAQGHMLPTLDMARVFSSRGVKSTMITTHQCIPMFEKSIQRKGKQSFTDISIRGIHFPAVEAGLPEGTESVDQIKSEHLIPHFIMATAMLQDQLEQLLEECRPHCLIADKFFPWATEAAAKFRIPRLFFDGMSFFANTAEEIMRVHRPFDYVSSDSEPFLVPDLPHEIKLTRAKIPSYERDKETAGTELGRFLQRVRDSDSKSYGRIVNSFYELEPEYVEYYTKILGRKAWHVGPFLLCNKEVEDKIGRGKNPTLMNTKQFLNEKLLADVLKVGVAVGSREWSRVAREVKGEALAKAVELVMVGEEAVKIRGRSKSLKDMARKAVEEGGSSYTDFDVLIKELKSYHSERDQE